MPLRHTFIADCETPVSAYLKLRGGGPSFLLESAEQGQRVGRWSFLGFHPRATIRMSLGDHPDPYAHVAEELGRYRIAPLEGLPPFAGGAVGLFGYDLVRSAEPSVGEPNPDETGIPDLALMITDVLVAFDHLRHEVTVLANVLTIARGRALDALATGRRRRAIAEVKERLAGPVPQIGRGKREPPEFISNIGRRRASPTRSSAPRSTSTPATPTRSCRASAGRPTARSTPSRSTAACARSTRARTCTSSTSRTSRSRARRPSRSSRSTAGAWS